MRVKDCGVFGKIVIPFPVPIIESIKELHPFLLIFRKE
jgi:hypothetical protein